MNDVFQSETAVLAAGCFWGVQYYFDQIPGVLETQVGYIGGKTSNPTYEQVCYAHTGHAEAIKIVFRPEQVTYKTLLRQFFRMHDPTQLNRQGPDIGTQYRSAIFPQSPKQKLQAEAVIKDVAYETGMRIVTTLEKADVFWPAENYHQKFTERTGSGMCHIPYAPV